MIHKTALQQCEGDKTAHNHKTPTVSANSLTGPTISIMSMRMMKSHSQSNNDLPREKK